MDEIVDRIKETTTFCKLCGSPHYSGEAVCPECELDLADYADMSGEDYEEMIEALAGLF